ncbi:MAG: molybdopterin-guanine dinucleotide biosynthesis protein B [Lawsonibacter sp.]|nr:molybdopterin-guanine dinucleotide biosynthesis protein B [Lawsonibacter sp.]
MNLTPVLAFVGYSNTGKTTLIERLIVSLKERGIRVAAVKHDAHEFDIDCKGKDSWRFSQAGAVAAMISSPTKSALVIHQELSLTQVLSLLPDVDLILVEGYKAEPLTKIGVCRPSIGKSLPLDSDQCLAVITDDKNMPISVPCFGFEELPAITEFILQNMEHISQL